MSVMSCNRRDCENIMCDKYSSRFGYICYECFDELVNLGIHEDVESFMNTRKKEETYDNIIDPYEYFNNIFSDN